MANNKLRARATQHEQFVSNKGPTACRMALGNMLGVTCLVPPLPDTTTDMWLAVIISLSCQLTSVTNVVGHVVLTVWCWEWCCSVMYVLRVRGASVAPKFHWVGDRKNTQVSRLKLTVHGIMLYTIPGGQYAKVSLGASLAKVPPEAHL